MSQEEFQLSPMYNFVRSRQLEGTFSQGPEVGVWIVTGMRVAKGWGDVQESAWPYSTKHWPPQEPPGIDKLAKKIRTLDYQRVRDSNECKVAIAGGRVGVVAAFEITNQWFSAVKGIIEEPSVSNPIVKKSHTVFIFGYDDNNCMFKFENSWGGQWGEGGCGYLPYSYFDNYILESWMVNNLFEGPRKSSYDPKVWQLNWGLKDVLGDVLHGVELYDAKEDEYIGWASAVCRAGFLDIEELFIRPQFRGSNNGKILTRMLNELAERIKLPLRLWVPHVDANPENLIRVEKIAKRLSIRLVPSGVRWASFQGVA